MGHNLPRRDIYYPTGKEEVMEKIVRLHHRIAPDLIAVVQERYDILRHIQYGQPIGRRALAAVMAVGERIVRAQVDFLKTAGLVEFSQFGMRLTREGEMILPELAEYIHLLQGLTILETTLAVELGVKRVVIVPGDSGADGMVQRELGRAAAGVLLQQLGNNMIVAVSGGSTLARVAEAVGAQVPTTTVVPARGGLGEQVEYQANTIAAVMAGRLNGHYRLLHIPDGIEERVMEMLQASDPNLPEVTAMIKRADILIHGIGRARDMAARRGLTPDAIAEIAGRGAVGEALGHYCTLQGEDVYVTSSVGLRLDDLNGVGIVIAVAGGRDKAEAIIAVTRAGGPDCLVTDEAAARAIQAILRQIKGGISNDDEGWN